MYDWRYASCCYIHGVKSIVMAPKLASEPQYRSASARRALFSLHIATSPLAHPKRSLAKALNLDQGQLVSCVFADLTHISMVDESFVLRSCSLTSSAALLDAVSSARFLFLFAFAASLALTLATRSAPAIRIELSVRPSSRPSG